MFFSRILEYVTHNPFDFQTHYQVSLFIIFLFNLFLIIDCILLLLWYNFSPFLKLDELLPDSLADH